MNHSDPLAKGADGAASIPSNPVDLIPVQFPDKLDWSLEGQEASLELLNQFVVNECTTCIKWYYSKKSSKSSWGFLLRLLSILLVALAGLIPLLSDLLPRQFGEGIGLQIAPGWSAVVLALVALLTGIDRFVGFTSGWVRYVRTAQFLTERQRVFQFAWEEQRRARLIQQQGNRLMPLADDMPPANHSPILQDPIMEAIKLCREFLLDVQTTVRRESDLWAQEFVEALKILQGPEASNGSSLGTIEFPAPPQGSKKMQENYTSQPQSGSN
jgi:hypothetical protein